MSLPLVYLCFLVRHSASPTLLSAFIAALTRSGPSGFPRPFELHAHDPTTTRRFLPTTGKMTLLIGMIRMLMGSISPARGSRARSWCLHIRHGVRVFQLANVYASHPVTSNLFFLGFYLDRGQDTNTIKVGLSMGR